MNNSTYHTAMRLTSDAPKPAYPTVPISQLTRGSLFALEHDDALDNPAHVWLCCAPPDTNTVQRHVKVPAGQVLAVNHYGEIALVSAVTHVHPVITAEVSGHIATSEELGI